MSPMTLKSMIRGHGENGTAPTGRSDWVVISSPNEGLNAAADINGDGEVNSADMAFILRWWGACSP